MLKFPQLLSGAPMRIEFPHSAREDFRWAQTPLRIGSAPDNDLVLAASQAASRHVRIQQDRRGWVLQVLPTAARVHVNARPVREWALLRAGDVVSVGDCRMLLRDDEDPAQRTSLDAARQNRCAVALRAVGGPMSGRVLPVKDNLILGHHGRFPLDLVQGELATLRVAWQRGELMLEAEAIPSSHPLRVNGVAVQRTALQPGDQISLAVHRFVVDAPGLKPEVPVVVAASAGSLLSEDAAGPRGEVWWLIVTAAILALGIALVLLIRF